MHHFSEFVVRRDDRHSYVRRVLLSECEHTLGKIDTLVCAASHHQHDIDVATTIHCAAEGRRGPDRNGRRHGNTVHSERCGEITVGRQRPPAGQCRKDEAAHYALQPGRNKGPFQILHEEPELLTRDQGRQRVGNIMAEYPACVGLATLQRNKTCRDRRYAFSTRTGLIVLVLR